MAERYGWSESAATVPFSARKPMYAKTMRGVAGMGLRSCSAHHLQNASQCLLYARDVEVSSADALAVRPRRVLERGAVCCGGVRLGRGAGTPPPVVSLSVVREVGLGSLLASPEGLRCRRCDRLSADEAAAVGVGAALRRAAARLWASLPANPSLQLLVVGRVGALGQLYVLPVPSTSVVEVADRSGSRSSP
ncbi:hypothetical protein AB1Y20_019840 [Prymnesium parvum]|uniref:Uncharacterized protein n=1 Tax=Prymnesium parvum TaxID=97485 RepID=A0AB34JX20_PRYPA